jgi:hypothetical protein
MSILKRIFDEYPEEGLLKVDGFNDAIIGVSSDIRIVYSLDKIIEILQKDMTEDEAVEFFYFNIESAYVGEKTPLYVKLIN